MNPVAAQKRILVVDDEPDVCFMLVERLTSWGYAVLTAQSGEEGWRLTKEERPDLILLDILMPKLKGRDFCEHLKADPQMKEIPVIFLTALGLPDHIKAGLDVGGDDYVTKPFQDEELHDRIKVCLSRHNHPQRKSISKQHEGRDAMSVGRRRTILVVEDEEEMAELLKERLESVGYEVHTETSGKAGLSYAVECQPALVILDLMLPDIHGYAVCKELRELSKPWVPPVLMLTAMAQPIDQLRGFARGADAYVTKPFNSNELLKTVALLLGE